MNTPQRTPKRRNARDAGPSEPNGRRRSAKSWIDEERAAIEAEGRPEPSCAAPAEEPEGWYRDEPPQPEEPGAEEPEGYLPFGPSRDHGDDDAPADAPPPSEEPPEPQSPRPRPRRELPAVRILSTAEIFAPQAPTNWLVSELQLAPGRPALLYGSAGAGKTIIAQSLALFVASGLPAWGQFPVRSGRVLHIDYDQGEHATRKRYQRLAAGHGINLDALGDRLRFMPFPPLHLSSGGFEAFLCGHCRDVALCIADSLRGALPSADENDSRIGAYLTIFARLSERTGTTFVILHHQGKAKDAAIEAPMTPRGSTALLGASGVALLVTGSKDGPKSIRVMRDSESFDGDRLSPFVLRFEDGAERALRVVYQGAAGEGSVSREPNKREELERAIMAHVAGHPGCNVSDVKEAVKGNGQEAGRMIDSLVSRRALRRAPGPRNAALLSLPDEPDGEGEPDP